MWPFLKNLRGYFYKPRYRLMKSHHYPNRWFLWDKTKKEVLEYFDSLDEARVYIHVQEIDCEDYKFFQ